MCGDPWNGPSPHEYGGSSATGTITGTYTEGQVVEISVFISTYHLGRYRFRVCVITDPSQEASQLTEDCLDQHVLVQANAAGAQTPGEEWWYSGGTGTETFPYQLPSGLTCDGVTTRCILQWNYLTGNTCTPPGTPTQYANTVLPGCLDPAAQYPEEFWNCADIVITPSGASSSGPPPPPSPPPPPKASRKLDPSTYTAAPWPSAEISTASVQEAPPPPA